MKSKIQISYLLIWNADDLGRPYRVWRSIVFRLVLINKFSRSGNV